MVQLECEGADSKQENTLKLCSCSIKRLYDKRPPSTGGFPQEGLSQIILPVTPYRISWREKKPSNYFALAAVMQGFLCSLIIPKLPYDMRDGPEYLYPNRDLLHAPKQYFADYKPLMDAMVAGLGKHVEGRSTLKD